MKKARTIEEGFTIIELVVILVIISIISTIAIGNYFKILNLAKGKQNSYGRQQLYENDYLLPSVREDDKSSQECRGAIAMHPCTSLPMGRSFERE